MSDDSNTQPVTDEEPIEAVQPLANEPVVVPAADEVGTTDRTESTDEATAEDAVADDSAPLPTTADLDEVAADLDRIDGELAELDRRRLHTP